MQAPPPTNSERLSWCLYDFANSAFPTLISTVAYAVYFSEVVAGGGPDGPLWWGLAITASMIIIGVLSPLVGAVADHSASKKKWLFFYASLCVVSTAALFLVGPGDLAAGTILFVVANIGFAGGNGIYNGFLPELSDEGSVGRLSGYGFALGYAGGLLALAICLPLLAGGLGPENQMSFRSSFVVTAAWFALFSVPIFLWMRERAVASSVPPGMTLLAAGYGRLRETFSRVRKLTDLFKFLGAFLIYNDGIETVIYFSSIYAVSVLGFSMLETVYLFMAVQGTALVGAVVFGQVTDRLGAKRTILITLALWSAVVAAAFFTTSKTQFWGIALVAGIGLGSNQAASRGLVRFFIPAGKDAEFYGFFALCGKFSAILGPAVYGIVSKLAGDQRIAILSVLVFFVTGGFLLMTVDVERGRRGAREFPAEAV